MGPAVCIFNKLPEMGPTGDPVSSLFPLTLWGSHTTPVSEHFWLFPELDPESQSILQSLQDSWANREQAGQETPPTHCSEAPGRRAAPPEHPSLNTPTPHHLLLCPPHPGFQRYETPGAGPTHSASCGVVGSDQATTGDSAGDSALSSSASSS